MVAAMKRPPAAILPILLGLSAGFLLACGGSEPQSPGQTPPPPAGTGAATGTGPGLDDTAGIPVACGCPSEAQDRDDCPCPDGQACAADHALGDPPPDAFTCRAECIPANEPLLWCFHVPNAEDQGGGCCSGVCRPDGLCGNPIAPTTGPSTDTDPSTDTGSSGDTGSTGDTGSSTGTGSSTDSGSSTDGTTAGTGSSTTAG
jgi:hypothetical protein